mgnify:FL=1
MSHLNFASEYKLVLLLFVMNPNVRFENTAANNNKQSLINVYENNADKNIQKQ